MTILGFFLTRFSGAAIMANADTNSSVKTGEKIITAGLFIQILFFGVFIFTPLMFHTRINKSPTSNLSQDHIPWRKHIWALYVASGFIMVRSTFRVIEYIEGMDGYLVSNEIFLYIFDAALMLCVVVISNVVHPNEINTLFKGGKITQRCLGCTPLCRDLSKYNFFMGTSQ